MASTPNVGATSRRRAARKASAKGAAPDREAEAGVHATALYIAQMTDELVKLARFKRLDLLTYLLEMAKLEAEICVRTDARRGARGA